MPVTAERTSFEARCVWGPIPASCQRELREPRDVSLSSWQNGKIIAIVRLHEILQVKCLAHHLGRSKHSRSGNVITRRRKTVEEEEEMKKEKEV